MANKYKNYREVDILNALPGYANNAWLTPTDFIDTFAETVGTAAIGNKFTIDDSIVYKTNKGSLAIYCAPKSVEGDGEVVGETHAKRFRWTPKIIMVGDGPELLEIVSNILNTTFLLHVTNGECEGTQKLQFGSKCTPCVVDAGSFKSGNLGDGRKQYEFTMEAFNKYFYNGTLTDYDPTLDV
ncbi:MAG: hypothetical protein ABI675_19455 [Chitinophagaceae bacterium]